MNDVGKESEREERKKRNNVKEGEMKAIEKEGLTQEQKEEADEGKNDCAKGGKEEEDGKGKERRKGKRN